MLRGIFVPKEGAVIGGCREVYAKHRELWSEGVVWI